MGVGVKQTSRLISRIKHREFGVLVTTSHVNDQAYQEIREDQHPIVILSGVDVVDILSRMGHGTLDRVQEFLDAEFPVLEDEAPSTEPRLPVSSPLEVEIQEPLDHSHTAEPRAAER